MKTAKMCQKHWNEVREEIEKQNLTKFVARSGEGLKQLMNAGGRDPLLNATTAITVSVIDRIGLGFVEIEPCPLCFVIADRAKHGITTPLDWIEGAVQDELEYFKTQGLIESH